MRQKQKRVTCLVSLNKVKETSL